MPCLGGRTPCDILDHNHFCRYFVMVCYTTLGYYLMAAKNNVHTQTHSYKYNFPAVLLVYISFLQLCDTSIHIFPAAV